ncbi:MAG: aspartate aminotransferase family protein [Chloroflexota bacterium]|nr:aspartate aminotransferase family protein [Chloroflexota bacterium]
MPTAIEKQFIDLHPGSRLRHETAKEMFPDGVTHDARRQHPFQLYYTHANGPHKYDVDGNRIIDFWSGHGSLILGHSHPDIVSAVQEQITKGTHLSGSTDLEIEWGRMVMDLIPSAEKVRFHSSGTEADMMAIRMARAYTGRKKVIKFEDHFHGWSDYVSFDGNGTGGIPEEISETMIVIPPNDISIVKKILEDDDDVAAIILEPTGAHMGLNPILPSFLQELRSITSQENIVLIFDEVVTGFRTSKGGAQSYYGITPDLTTLAKILGGGLPGGAVAGKSEIINMIQPSGDPEWDKTRRIAHNGTFNANPLSAAAGITALKLLRNEPINDLATSMGQRLKEGLNGLLAKLEIPGCASGINSLIHLRLGVDHECDRELCLMTDQEMKITTDSARNAQLNLALLNKGIHSGTRFILSATHTEADIDETVEAFELAFTDLKNQGNL